MALTVGDRFRICPWRAVTLKLSTPPFIMLPAAGLCMVFAAGNSNEDARHFSPASEPLAYTVGSIDATDTNSGFYKIHPSHPTFIPFDKARR